MREREREQEEFMKKKNACSEKDKVTRLLIVSEIQIYRFNSCERHVCALFLSLLSSE